jgi:hypothetical protein
MATGTPISLYRFALIGATTRRGWSVLGCIALFHAVALIMMVSTETDLVAKVAFLLV